MTCKECGEKLIIRQGKKLFCSDKCQRLYKKHEKSIVVAQSQD